ncbi:hypothetical protein CCS01_01255 [Rhodopila globiformis]|uniref:Uncharacterized protein n=2 Tax=Rhodopila globiformis TaxID=1071 RepID=A0A2S6NNX3_RHOGL|nr:hypothetical protein CCS01_01255 [Rhodopila globiformis]
MRDDVLLPAHHDPARRYPVVLYLRQPDMGNSSDRLRRQAGAWFGTEVFRFRHSCIVMMPMLEQRHDPGGVEINVGGKGPHRSGEHNLAAALRQVVDCYLVDLDQFHVTEPSTDGMGSWQMPPD